MTDDYRYCASLSRDQWAWEFLRRNPCYQSDYRQFIVLWQALEANYGTPPNRDFQRWKRDPRAYGPLPGDRTETAENAADACIGEDEQVLLECWLGAKWGFNKFPLDPQRALPPTPDELSWRPVPAKSANAIEREYRLDIAFDLSLPVPPQLDAARFRLAGRVAELRRSGRVAPRTIASERDHWMQLLQALDCAGDPFDTTGIAAREEDLRARLLDEARAMVDAGYRDILRLAE